MFADDDSVLFVSLHQWPFYPGTGGPDDQRETTLNIPLPAGSGDDEYLRAFEELVEPAVARFEPELVLVSAGFDAHDGRPARRHARHRGRLPRARRRCAAMAPRVAAVLEGGYELETLPGLVAGRARRLPTGLESQRPPFGGRPLPRRSPAIHRLAQGAVAVHGSIIGRTRRRSW